MPTAPVKLKLVALPTEHGGWGLLGAPILLGLLLAPSWSGLYLSLAAVSAFLFRHPSKLAMGDLRRGKRYPRTGWALRFTAAYGLIALVALIGSLLTAKSSVYLPLTTCVGLAGINLLLEARSRGRALATELLGACTLSMLAWPIMSASGGNLFVGLAASLFLAWQGASALIYVRARLRLERGEPSNLAAVWILNILGVAICAALAIFFNIVWWTIPLIIVLVGRTLWGLSGWRRRVRPSSVGIQEVLYTLMSVLAIYLTLR